MRMGGRPGAPRALAVPTGPLGSAGPPQTAETLFFLHPGTADRELAGRRLPESATNSALASGLMAMLVGSLKCAAPPTLSVHTELRVYRAVCAHHASSVQARTLNPPRRARTQAQRERPGVPNGS